MFETPNFLQLMNISSYLDTLNSLKNCTYNLHTIDKFVLIEIIDPSDRSTTHIFIINSNDNFYES